MSLTHIPNIGDEVIQISEVHHVDALALAELINTEVWPDIVSHVVPGLGPPRLRAGHASPAVTRRGEKHGTAGTISAVRRARAVVRVLQAERCPHDTLGLIGIRELDRDMIDTGQEQVVRAEIDVDVVPVGGFRHQVTTGLREVIRPGPGEGLGGNSTGYFVDLAGTVVRPDLDDHVTGARGRPVLINVVVRVVEVIDSDNRQSVGDQTEDLTDTVPDGTVAPGGIGHTP